MSNMETKKEAAFKINIEGFHNWLDEKTIELDRKAKTSKTSFFIQKLLVDLLFMHK